MAVRYTHTFYSVRGSKYIVHLHDSEFTGTAAACELLMPGFVHSLSGQGDDIYEPIKGSEVIIQFDVRKSTEETFITDIIGAVEGRFFIEIFRTSTSNRWWAGILLQDLISIPDIGYPFPVELTFTDGLGTLADRPYDNAGLFYAGRDTFIEHLVLLLEKTDTAHLWGSSDVFLETKVNYYETSHGSVNAAKCPLQYSDLDYNAFKLIDQKTKEPEAMDSLEVLKHICRVWGARLMLSNGRWVFEQVNETVTSATVRRFSKDGTYLSNATGSRLISESVFKRSSGLYRFNPAILEMTQSFNWKIGVDATNLLPDQQTFDPAIEVCYVEENSTALDYFNFAGTLHFYGQYSVQITDQRRGVWAFEIAIETAGGTKYYFQNTLTAYPNNYGVWSTTPGYFYVVRSFPTNVTFYNVLHSMNFNTPQFPADGDVTFKFVHVRIERYQNGSWVTSSLPGGSTFSWACDDYTLTIVELTNATYQYISGSYNYKAVNQTSGVDIKASVKKELEDIVIGDSGSDTGYSAYIANRIRCSADGTTWNNSTPSGWAIGAITSSGYEINKLRILEQMIASRVPAKRYEGSIIYKNYLPENVFTIGSEFFVVNGGSFEAANDVFQAETFTVVYNRSNYSNVEFTIDYSAETGDDPNANPTDGGGAAMSEAINVGELLRGILNLMAITYTDADISGSTTSFSCYRISEQALKSGDQIIVVTPTGWIDEFTVSADQAADAESISVTTKTPSVTIPAESAVIVRSAAIKNFFNQVPRIIRTTSDPSSAPAAAGNIYINTSTGTIWVANGTASSSNWIQVNNLD